MKHIKSIFVAALTLLCVNTNAQQVDFSNPAYAKWGATTQERETNMHNNSYLRAAVTNGDYNEAARLFNLLATAVPEATDAIFARGIAIYRKKSDLAKSLSDKKMFVDSLMIVYDLRAKYYGDHETRGTAYILDAKARDFFKYNKMDRAGLREVFKAMIAANGDKADAQLVATYFQNLCDDYGVDEVMSSEVLSEYERLAPYFAKLTGDNAKFNEQFNSLFIQSGAATCEDLERLFSAQIEADPTNADLLSKVVAIMGRNKCQSPYYYTVVENLYELKPNSASAMALAATFQAKGEYDKALKYLKDALATEQDIEEQEALNARIAVVSLALNDMSAAYASARASLNTDDGTIKDNGIALFVIAQCYANAAGRCEGFEGQATYWVAYETMAKAIANFSSEESDYKEVARRIINTYPQYYPMEEEYFMRDLKEGSPYTIKCGIANGIKTTVRKGTK
ncbi:MAG: tetratricopeptide repeat protein [Rikenellaceae bacterium]